MERTASFGIGTSPSNSNIEPQSFVCREVLVVITTIALSIITAIIAFSTLPAELALIVTIIATIGEYMMMNSCFLNPGTTTKVCIVSEASQMNFAAESAPVRRDTTVFISDQTLRSRAHYTHQAPYLGRQGPAGRRRSNPFENAPSVVGGFIDIEEFPVGSPSTCITTRDRPSEFPGSPLASASVARAQTAAQATSRGPIFPGNPSTRGASRVAAGTGGSPIFPGNPSARGASCVAAGTRGLSVFPGQPLDRR